MCPAACATVFAEEVWGLDTKVHHSNFGTLYEINRMQNPPPRLFASSFFKTLFLRFREKVATFVRVVCRASHTLLPRWSEACFYTQRRAARLRGVANCRRSLPHVLEQSALKGGVLSMQLPLGQGGIKTTSV